MENLVGQQFNIDDTDYAIVDVRSIRGDTLIYAEPTVRTTGLGRAAFRLVDIESRLASLAEQ